MSAVITTIFAPATDPALEATVLRSLAATSEAFVHGLKIGAIDVASPAVRTYLKQQDWCIVEAPAHLNPPRMTALLADALEIAASELVWTIEHDVIITGATRLGCEKILRAHPATAAIEAWALNQAGKPTRPCVAREWTPLESDRRILRAIHGTSFNCVCWRAEALRQVDWSLVPRWQKADTHACRQLLARGWKFFIASHLACIHLRANSGASMREWSRSSA